MKVANNILAWILSTILHSRTATRCGTAARGANAVRNSCNAVPTRRRRPPVHHRTSPHCDLYLFAPPPQSSSSLPQPLITESRCRRSLTLAASRRGGCWRGWIRASSAPSSPSPGSFSSSPDSGLGGHIYNEAGSGHPGRSESGSQAQSAGSSSPSRRGPGAGRSPQRVLSGGCSLAT